MWWMFKRISETGSVLLYAYSRESRQLDGRISINRDTGNIEMNEPCLVDKGIPFAEEKAIEKAWQLLSIGCPEEKQIACG